MVGNANLLPCAGPAARVVTIAIGLARRVNLTPTKDVHARVKLVAKDSSDVLASSRLPDHFRVHGRSVAQSAANSHRHLNSVLSEKAPNLALGVQLPKLVTDKLNHVRDPGMIVLHRVAVRVLDVTRGQRRDGDSPLSLLPLRGPRELDAHPILASGVEGENQANELRVRVAEVENLSTNQNQGAMLLGCLDELQELWVISAKAREIHDLDNAMYRRLDTNEQAIEIATETWNGPGYSEISAEDVDLLGWEAQLL